MASTRLHPKSTAATRTVKTRRPTFDHDQLGDNRYFWDGDLLQSHLIAMLSALIPAGERFVVDAVRSYRRGIDDPDLAAQASAFMGQEIVHQREHDRFNVALGRLGYPTALVDRAAGVLFAGLNRLPRRSRVAMTAAIEHYTAVLAEHVLAEGWLDRWQLDPVVRSFMGWHLVEELEHKAVAFDTMQWNGVSEPERVAAMVAITGLLLPIVVAGLAVSLGADPGTRRPRRVVASLDRLRHGPFASRTLVTDLLAYERPDFHPDGRDSDALLERWRSSLVDPLMKATA